VALLSPIPLSLTHTLSDGRTRLTVCEWAHCHITLPDLSFPPPTSSLIHSTDQGHSNAYTSDNDTVYYFDVAHKHLRAAIDRFAQFFIAPLLNASCTERQAMLRCSEDGLMRASGHTRPAPVTAPRLTCRCVRGNHRIVHPAFITERSRPSTRSTRRTLTATCGAFTTSTALLQIRTTPLATFRPARLPHQLTHC
jgi:hypothetical protein